MEKIPSFEINMIERDSSQEISRLMNSLKSNLDSIDQSLVNFDINKIDKIINLCQESYSDSENFLIDNKENFKDINILDKIHSLKNYFGGIMGFCNYIKSGEAESDEEIKIFIGYMRRAVLKSHDLLMINEGEQKNININELTTNLINQFNVQFLNKNIKIENHLEDVEVITDPKVLSSSLDNLISNAIKFSNQNGVINIWSEKIGNKFKIYVKDEGSGISKDRLNNFFNQYGSTSVGTNGEAGTGVGMFTSKKLINNIGGDIEVESEEGKGSTFVITLPLE